MTRSTHCAALFGFIALLGLLAFGAARLPMAEAVSPAGDPVNSTCPISDRAVNPSITVEYGGATIGLCCRGCVGSWKNWSDEKRQAFLTKATTTTTSPPASTTPDAAKPKGDPYTLAKCPVSGARLGSMGDPVVKQYDGREVRFCCAGCVEPFEADQKAMFKKIDRDMAKAQIPYFPMDECIVMGDPLMEDGEDISINYVHNNRLVRVCCKMCVRGVKKSPSAYMKQLDALIVKQQGARYPLDTCVISGNPLGDKPAQMIVGNRLVRVCCPGCKPAFKKDPAKYLAIIDAAWRQQGGVNKKVATDSAANPHPLKSYSGGGS